MYARRPRKQMPMNLPSHRTVAGERSKARVLSWLVFALVAGWCPSSHAQWITQTNILRPGWNSVFLHVSASHTNVNSLINALDPIDEVWLWTHDLPPGLALATPPDPTPSSQWSKWTKLEGPNSVLKSLPANAALLVKASANFNWRVKGRPVAPNYRWTLTGLNFVGFPTASSAPNFEAFLRPDAQALDWKLSSEIFRYQGGTLGATNPIDVSAILQRSVPVVREQAYWIRAGEPTNQVYNHYFGPFQVTGSDASGLRFGDTQGQARLHLKNMTKGPLTVTLNEVASETPPTGTAPALLPLMVRGPINTTNLTFGYSNLTSSPSSWSLTPNGQPGSEVEIILGVDRSQMGGAAGTTFAGVLRFTDSLGLTRVEIGASATTASRAGLWVGNAVVDNVSQYLKPYTKATNVAHFHQRLNALGLTSGRSSLPVALSQDGHRYEWDTNTTRILVFGGAENSKGQYLADGPILVAPDRVARPFPLRLIVHHDGTRTRLMQRAYLGRNSSSNQVVAARQAVVAGDLANARRLSAVHLPTSDANGGPWNLTGTMQPGASLETTVDIPFDDQASNPFLHSFHPDHDNIDNRDDTFQEQLPSGKESYDLRRLMTLNFTVPGNDFDSRTRSGTSLTGSYAETVSYRAADTVLKQFNVLGTFSLTRVTDTAEYAQ